VPLPKYGHPGPESIEALALRLKRPQPCTELWGELKIKFSFEKAKNYFYWFA